MKIKMTLKIKIIAAALILCMVGAFYIDYLRMHKSRNTNNETNITILIDPGHGGADPGKAGRLQNESIINLSISQKLAEILKAKGFIVVMTRTEENGIFAEGSTKWDKDVDMDIRKSMIKISNASIMVSIHQNSYSDSRCMGAQVFYSSNLTENQQLADIMQNQLKLISPFENKRMPQINNNLKMIRENDIPTIIIECGFLSNKEEEYLLNTDEYQMKMAQAIYKGICEFYKLAP